MQIKPLAHEFGAEVRGLDVQRECAPGDIEALRATYEQWHLLVQKGDPPALLGRQ